MANAPHPTRQFDRSIVEGPVLGSVWKLAWPTVLQNMIGGMQGVVDHAMVGHYVGFAGNAAIELLLKEFSILAYLHFHPFRKRVDHADAHAVQPARDLVRGVLELATGVKLGEHYLGG